MALTVLKNTFLKKTMTIIFLTSTKKKMKAEIERAEKEADITVVMPQMGIEYQLEPTEEQKKLYHKMIDWGADIIFGGHPHVVEPAETVDKDGDKKLIIYLWEISSQISE